MPATRVDDDLTPGRAMLVTVGVVILGGGLWQAARTLVGEQFAGPVANLVLTLVLLGAGIGVVQTVRETALVIERRGHLTAHQTEAVYRSIQILAYGAVIAVSVIYVWEVSVANVLLGAGVTSVIVALAARQTLTSVFAGVSLFSTDVFRVGDWVKVDERFGQIERITLFNGSVSAESPSSRNE